MSIINNKPQYATGLVRPKTTSIFFDKILVTDDLLDNRLIELGYSNIPEEVLLRPLVPRRFEHEILHFFMDMDLQEPKKPYDENSYNSLDGSFNVYKYSSHRNYRIYEAIEYYRALGINIVPIYFSPTDYERHFLSREDEKKHLVPTISICINQMPEIIEENLTWQQVLDIRKDKKAIAKVRRFKNWMTIDLINKRDSEIAAILEKALEDYKWALRKHGIQTTIGAITTIETISATLTGALSDGASFLLPGIIISSGVTVFAVKSFVDAIEARRHPIAIIYDLIKNSTN